MKTPNLKYYLMINEINRCNSAKVLGEILYAMEHRGVPVQTNHGNKIIMPSNVYILATMSNDDNDISTISRQMETRFGIYYISGNVDSISGLINSNDKHILDIADTIWKIIVFRINPYIEKVKKTNNYNITHRFFSGDIKTIEEFIKNSNNTTKMDVTRFEIEALKRT